MKMQYKKPATKVTALNNDSIILANSLGMNNEVGDNANQRSKRFQWSDDASNNENSPWGDTSN